MKQYPEPPGEFCRRLLASRLESHVPGTIRLFPVRANGQPAFAGDFAGPDGVPTPWSATTVAS